LDYIIIHTAAAQKRNEKAYMLNHDIVVVAFIESLPPGFRVKRDNVLSQS
jgi:hypothetical protein